MAGRYKFLEELGAGGAGAVYKAFDTQLDRYVAVKRLLSKEDAEKDTANSDRLQKEAASLATLQHPNIVSVFDIASDEKGFFMVMELLEGETLADWMHGDPMNLKDFYELATQSLEAILTAHHKNILHRDLKPENIKVTRLPGGRLQAKILDFGLARIMKGNSRKMTEDQDGNVTGSIYYMAPEQLKRDPVDERTDLYAIGCVFYHALSGRRPFEAETLTEVIDLHLNHQVYPLQEVSPQVPSAIAEWVMWLMNLNPGHRPETAQQALEYLKQLHQLGWFKTADDEEIVAPIMEEPVIVAKAVLADDESPRRITGSVNTGVPAAASVGSKRMHKVDANSPSSPISSSPAYSSTTFTPGGEPPVSTLGSTSSADPFEPPPQGLPKWVIPTALLTLICMGGGYYWQSQKKQEEAVKAQEAQVTAITRPQNLLNTGNVITYVAGEKTYSNTDPKNAQSTKTGQSVAVWHDMQKSAGDATLKTPDDKPESQPAFQAGEHLLGFRPSLDYLTFKTGNALVSRVDKKTPESKQMPFGASTRAKGVTIISLIRPTVTDKVVNCFQLRNQDNKASITFSAAPKNEGIVTIEVGKTKKEIKLTGADWSKFNLVTIVWDGQGQKALVTARAMDGVKAKADSAAPKFTEAEPLNELKLSATQPNDSFYGDIAELSVWHHPMKPDERNLQEWKYAQYYFAKPGTRF